MTEQEFELILTKTVIQLGNEVTQSTQYHNPDAFEARVRDVLQLVAEGENIRIVPTFHPHAFPDIRANGFGVEVKTTNKDNWQSVGNSVFEGMRDGAVKKIWVIFGKMGGMPAVRWGRYEERITHVRISHAPRFVLEMDKDSSLFGKMKISYEDFSKLPAEEKMQHIRKYSKARLKPGERLWWLEDENSVGIPVAIKLYMSLSNADKKKLRAEGALMCPQICGGSRQKDKYNDVAFFMLRHRNVFCPQTRDLFSAGSVAGKERGGNYVLRALKNIETEMRQAVLAMDGALFVEYWGKDYPPAKRIGQWLKRADSFASGWKPSSALFISG
jgi:hypothetical protein